MVYCGKASQGCQHCRTRRIKCDKVRPECSQCVRAGKQCPGYRDQLSLMFRDENFKVMQRAHAQWGVPASSGSSSAASGSPSASASPISFVNTGGSTTPAAPKSRRSWSVQQAIVAAPRIPKVVQPTVFEKGMQFYVDHYVLGYPQEPQTAADMQDSQWLSAPDTAGIMAAVGLSGLSNLTGDLQMEVAARQRYGVALRNTAKSIQNPARLDPRIALKTVVLLTMFEVVQGRTETAGVVRAHIMGAAALLTSLAPSIPDPTGPFRGLVQLYFSMLIPCHTLGISVPQTAVEWIVRSKASFPPHELSSAELLLILCCFLRLSASLHGQPPTSDSPRTTKLMSNAMMIEEKLAAWEEQNRQAGGPWAYTTEEAALSPECAFGNRYQVYMKGMPSARIWNHYRWARILVNQTLIELGDMTQTLDPRDRDRHLETIRRMVDDLLVSVPTHYRHPRLTQAQRAMIDRTCKIRNTGLGTGGIGAAGLASLTVQLKVAGKAAGVPREYRQWAHRMLETVWCETGMLQAKMLADELRAHLDRGPSVKAELVEVKEEHKPWPIDEPLALRSGR